jgi:outer membrane lipoprotein-sorting protein
VTKFDDRTPDDPIDGLDAHLASDLHELYAAPVPDLAFQRPVPTPRSGWLSQLLHNAWRPATALGAAGLAVAAVLVGPSLWSGESQVSAETIFARASTAAQSNAAAGSQSYHLIATTSSGGQSTSSTTEIWYANSSHQRNENEYTGDGIADFGVTVNGTEAWMYGDFGGDFRAVHGPASEIGMSFPTETGATSLADVLGQYNGGCQKAAQDGEETIAGRAAYRIVVTADFDTCPAFQDGREKYDKFGTLVLSVDKETFLPLKTEQRGDGLMPEYTYEVTQIQVGGDFPDATFSYTAPPGITVQDVDDLTQAKNVISGLAPDGTPLSNAP